MLKIFSFLVQKLSSSQLLILVSSWLLSSLFYIIIELLGVDSRALGYLIWKPCSKLQVLVI